MSWLALEFRACYTLSSGDFCKEMPSTSTSRIRSTLYKVLAFMSLWSMAGYCDEVESTVIVTSTVSKLPITDVSTTVFEISERNSTLQALDMFRGLPGIAVSQSGQRGSLGQVRMRGAEADHVKILIDGVEANDPGSELNWGTLSSVDVKRIEILNGPRSSVWGDHALAGVVNLDTLPTSNQTSVHIGTGSNASRLVQFDRERTSEDAFFGMSLKHTKSDGENAGFIGEEKDGFEQLSGNVIGGKDFKNWHVQASVRGNDTLSE